MSMKLLPFDPADALLAQVAALVRGGIADWSGSPQPQPSWTGDDACPANHFCCKQGTRLFVDREPGGIQCTPALVLFCPEEGREKSAEVRGAWAITLMADVITQKDGDRTDALALISRLLLLVTHPVRLEDDSLQQPQDRLNTDNLHVFGRHYRNNFEDVAFGRFEEWNDHPRWRFSVKITCALYVES